MKIFKKLFELFDKDYTLILTQTKPGILTSAAIFILVMIFIILALVHGVSSYFQVATGSASYEPNMYINYKVNVFFAFIYGLLSFLSPLTPLILLVYFCYLGCVANISFEKINETGGEEKKETKYLFNKIFVLFHSVLFFTGFFFGIFLAKAICSEITLRFLPMDILSFGIFALVWGFCALALEKPKFIPKKISSFLSGSDGKKSLRVGMLMVSCAIGLMFGNAWAVSCVNNPYLNSVLCSVGIQSNALAGDLLLLFCFLGFGTPFILSISAFMWFLLHSNKISRYRDTIVLVCCILLMLLGLFIIFSYTSEVPSFINWLRTNLKNNA